MTWRLRVVLISCNFRSAKSICRDAKELGTFSRLTEKYGQPDKFITGIDDSVWAYYGHDGGCYITAHDGPITKTLWQPRID
jgi:hypothetical protein